MSCYRLIVIEHPSIDYSFREKLEKAVVEYFNEVYSIRRENDFLLKNTFKCVDYLNPEDLETNDLNFAVVICDGKLDKYNSDQIDVIIKAGIPLLPVFFKGFKAEVVIPLSLRSINALEINDNSAVDEIFGYVIDNLYLKKGKRKIFISYKRDEAQSIADQLHDTLIRYGYDVFLDTVSIEKGDDFQKELKHRMADSDVVLLLNTFSYLSSEWTESEFLDAQAAKIGILHLDWPDADIPAEMSNVLNMISSVKLNEEDFDISNACKFSCPKSKLKNSVIGLIIEAIENLRIKNIAARRIMMVNEFCEFQRFHNYTAEYNPSENIIKVGNGYYYRSYYPIIGVPNSQIFNSLRKSKLKHEGMLSILYNSMLVRNEWVDYLNWLDIYLPIRTESFNGTQKEE